MGTIGNERFRCPEALFDPSMIGMEQLGMHQAAFQTIQDCDIDIRNDLYENIVISGGTTMFKGLQDRLQSEIQSKAPATVTVEVEATEERDAAAKEAKARVGKKPAAKAGAVAGKAGKADKKAGGGGKAEKKAAGGGAGGQKLKYQGSR